MLTDLGVHCPPLSSHSPSPIQEFKMDELDKGLHDVECYDDDEMIFAVVPVIIAPVWPRGRRRPGSQGGGTHGAEEGGTPVR